jgi:translation elongation factor EF-Tu-like GTPase
MQEYDNAYHRRKCYDLMAVNPFLMLITDTYRLHIRNERIIHGTVIRGSARKGEIIEFIGINSLVHQAPIVGIEIIAYAEPQKNPNPGITFRDIEANIIDQALFLAECGSMKYIKRLQARCELISEAKEDEVIKFRISQFDQISTKFDVPCKITKLENGKESPQCFEARIELEASLPLEAGWQFEVYNALTQNIFLKGVISELTG